jgi:ABC-type branched-subunit amino acid transport system substrate-binding protein
MGSVGVTFERAAWGLGLLALVAACGPTKEPPPPPEPEVVEPQLPPEIRVGLLLPLSGPVAELGRDMLEAAEMALFDVGANRLRLLPRDTGGTAEGARLAAEQVLAEGAEVLLGPLLSQAVAAVSPLAAQADVRVLAFSNVAEMAGPGTYLLGFRPEEQVTRVIRYAVEHLETVPDELPEFLQPPPDPLAPVPAPTPALVDDPFADEQPLRIAALGPDDAYGATAMAAFRGAMVEVGAEMGPAAVYPPELADPSAVVRSVADYDRRKASLEREVTRFETQLEANDPAAGAQAPDEAAFLEAKRVLKELETLDTLGMPPFDTILLADGSDRLRSVAALLNFFDVDPAQIRYLGTLRWQADPRVLREAALQGGWFTAPLPSSVAAFQQRFESIFGRPPQQPALVGLAYDATALAVIVADRQGDRAFTAASLTNPQGFAGVTGLFRLRPDGLTEHGLAVLEVDAGEARLIDPPPERFVDPDAPVF